MGNNVSYISGAIHYPFIFEGHKDKFDRYSVVVTLEGDQVRNAKQAGLKVSQAAEKFDGLPYVSLKSTFPPKLFNADKTNYSGPTRLANGSTAVAKVSQRAYDNKFGKGITTFVMAMMITDPIEFVPDGDFAGGGGAFADFVPTVPSTPLPPHKPAGEAKPKAARSAQASEKLGF